MIIRRIVVVLPLQADGLIWLRYGEVGITRQFLLARILDRLLLPFLGYNTPRYLIFRQRPIRHDKTDVRIRHYFIVIMNPVVVLLLLFGCWISGINHHIPITMSQEWNYIRIMFRNFQHLIRASAHTHQAPTVLYKLQNPQIEFYIPLPSSSLVAPIYHNQEWYSRYSHSLSYVVWVRPLSNPSS